MGKRLEKLIEFTLSGIQFFSFSLLLTSVILFSVSYNPDVTWNKYNIEAFQGFYAFYFHTLWSSVDAYAFDPTEGSMGKYLPMLDLDAKNGLKFHDGSWKIPIRKFLVNTIGTASGSLVVLLFGVIAQNVTREKSVVIILEVISIANGIAAVVLANSTLNHYKDSIPGVLAVASNAYYNPDEDRMALGYALVKCGAAFILTGSIILMIHVCLFGVIGKGEWLLKKIPSKVENDG